jgi:hypothetical protein
MKPAYASLLWVCMTASVTAGVTAWGAPAPDSELENAISEVPAATAAKPAPGKEKLEKLGAPPPISAVTSPDPLAIPMPSALATSGTMPLIDLFSSEKNPGRGTLEYWRGSGDTEKITFGAETGHYIIGMVFAHDTLPRSLQEEFKNNEVVQLALGTLNRSAESRVSQFGTATLKVLRRVSKVRLLPLRIPGIADAPLPESGFLLFTSPGMQAQLSDEEKLKGTFFAREGALTLTATADPKPLSVAVEGRKIPFKMQAMRMEVQATLSTPFNSEEHQLRGTVEFPLYWPEGAVGKRIAREMAEAGFNAKSSIQIPEEFSASRQLAREPRSRPRPAKRHPTTRP